ncbi:MAG: cell envelope integrity protein CreD, partial [Cyclobacteriaceae bacterium]|nr:cell envelope integrity protein CreD [Cyclobacteriaceae bacterium]
IRTAKYSVLIILFTFIALFFIEITQHIRIHPVQYILIGSALIIYYTLLLSLSEQTGFNVAYGIASAATIALITAYASTFLKKQTFLLASLLLVFYGFIFFITLLEDYALLTGSIGLFMVVAALMYASRKINWYST